MGRDSRQHPGYIELGQQISAHPHSFQNPQVPMYVLFTATPNIV